MRLSRVYFPALFVLLGGVLPAAAQSVVSTHAGVVHYFEGAVSLGGAPLQPQFGRFPEIAEGAELRTAEGRAEVLLGPGVILRMAEDSAVKMVSSVLTDTRLELLSGTAILSAKDALPGNSVTVLYKDWRVRIPGQGVYRIDSNPERLRVYDGEVEVSAAKSEPVTAKAGQTLPLAPVLEARETVDPPGDEFNSWAFDRTEAVAADNATADQITDDPALYPDLAGPAGLSMAGYTYFPPTVGSPAPGYNAYAGNPYLSTYIGYSYAPRVGYTYRPLPPLQLLHSPTVGGYHPLPLPLHPVRPPLIPHTAPPVVHPVHR